MIGLGDVRALARNQIIWDLGRGAVAGFGARRRHGDSVVYFLKYRNREGRQRWYKIGRHGAPWTPDSAREQAKKILGDIVHGADPAAERQDNRHTKTVAELCDDYMTAMKGGRILTRRGKAKKVSTIATDEGRIKRHIKPLLGARSVTAVTQADVERFMHDVAEGKTAIREKTRPRGVADVTGGEGTATRTVGLLGGIFSYAVRQGMRLHNPVHGVVRYADGERDRRLSDEEYRKLGLALRLAEEEGVWPAAIAAVRMIAFTGWRKSEVLELRGPIAQAWVDAMTRRDRAKLPDTKTGPSARILSLVACVLLKELSLGQGWAFPASRGTNIMSGFDSYWSRIMKLGDLPADITPHVLRHSFASLAGDLGATELEIAVLLGHSKNSTTAKYHHPGEPILRAIADATAQRTAELMGEREPNPNVVNLSDRRRAFG
jgi:integrase